MKSKGYIFLVLLALAFYAIWWANGSLKPLPLRMLESLSAKQETHHHHIRFQPERMQTLHPDECILFHHRKRKKKPGFPPPRPTRCFPMADVQ